MPRSATIRSLLAAFRMMKRMEAQGIEWGEDYRRAGAQALKDVLEGRMAGAADRRNGASPPVADDGARQDRACGAAHAERRDEEGMR